MQVRQQYVFYVENLIYWCLSNQKEWHRNRDLPAYIYFKNEELYAVSYWKYNRLHRITGPAIMNYRTKTKLYYHQGRRYDSLEKIKMLEACR